MIEYTNGDVGFLISDGHRYFENPEHWIIDIDRSFWGYMNYFEKYFDPLGAYFIKIINLPVLLIFLNRLQKSFPVLKQPHYVILVYPYLLFCAISNLRDIEIWLFALLVFQCYHKKTILSFLAAGVLGIGLYMLRPFMCATAIIAILIVEFYPLINVFKKVPIKKRLMKGGLVLLVIVIVGLVFPLITPKFETYLYNGRYLLTSGYVRLASDRHAADIVDANNILESFLISNLRYIFTPKPQSLVKRLVYPKHSDGFMYGRTSEYLRVYNQVVYYYLILMLLINIRKIKKTILCFSPEQWCFVLWTFAFLPIYSFVHIGGSHQRLKLPFQLLILITYMTMKKSNVLYYLKQQKKALSQG